MDDIADKIQSLLSDEESLNQIKELAAMLSGENAAAEENVPDGSGGFPFFALMQVMSAAGAANSDDKDCELLLALRPHLSPEKQLRADRAVKLLKLYNVFTALRESGALEELEKML